jgi:hypothetical protein
MKIQPGARSMATAMRSRSIQVAVLILLLAGPSRARRQKTIAFVPDPSCRGNSLVTVVDSALAENLKVKGVKVVGKEKGRANILLQYFLLVRREGDRAVVQLDGRAFENASGKLLAEDTVSSDPHSSDASGRKAAALQAGQLLAERLSVSVGEALWAKGKGRRIMLQITLEEGIGLSREDVLGRLERVLRGMSLRHKGSSKHNLVVVFKSSERKKILAESLETALVGSDRLEVSWVVQSASTLILRLGKAP